MNINLEVAEINFLLQTLGELPSKTGAWPLILKIKEQADKAAAQAQAPTGQ